MEQEIRFCLAEDGIRLAYATVGRGAPLVKTANWLNHLEFDWESPVWRHVFRELASRHRLVRYDERGNGLSDWEVGDFSFDCMVRDLETVVDAAGLERFALLGISQGCAVAIAYAVRHPERVSRMILYGGYPTGWRVRASPEEIRRREALVTLTQEGWASGNDAYIQLFTSLYIPDGTPEQVRWFNDLQRMTTSPDNAAKLQDVFGRIDVRALLPQVRVPTLVMHARDEAVIPFSCGRELAAGIPDARFVSLEGRNHLLLETEPAWMRFAAEVRSFLGEEGDVDTARPGPEEGDDERWRRADALFSELLDLPADRRQERLSRPENAEVRAQVERLLTEAERTDGTFLPAGALKGPIGDRLVEEILDTDGDSSLVPAPLPRGFEPGRTIAGRYQLEERIGRGGMGVVFRAHDVTLDRDVALKVAASTGGDAAWRQRTLREARSAAALNHPNVVAIHDVGEADGLPYLVLELVPGPTLAARPPRGVEEVLQVGRQICDALEHAHRRGIIHRDLKPTNVLWVRREGTPQVKLADLGVALMARDPRITMTGKIIGTPSYMAPEQATGKEIDARTDLYSLGVMLYEWLTGSLPFAADSALGVVAQHVHAEVVPASRRRPGLPAGVDDVLRRLLAKQPSGRFRSAEDLRRALDRIIPDEDGAAPEPAAAAGPDRSTPVAVDARTLAHEWHMRGCHHFYRGGAAELEQARLWFQRSLEVDPTYALAWAGLSLCCSWTFLYHRRLSPGVDEAVAAGARAVELASGLAEARVARGLALSLEGRDLEAGDEFERALVLDGSLFEAHYLYGRFCFSRGVFERAAGLFADAFALRPEEIQTPGMLAKSLLRLGRHAEARDALKRALVLAERRRSMDGNDLRALANGSRALVGLEQRERGLEWASRARELDPVNPLLYYAACARAQAGDLAGALEMLEEIVDAGWADLRWLDRDGDLDPVRDDPRFQRLLRRPAP